MKTIEITDHETIESLIAEAKTCYIALCGTDGVPYVLPMNFGYKEGVFYLHSGRHGRKIELLKQNPRICINITTSGELVRQHPDVACSYSMRSQSLIAEGAVEFIDDFDQKVEALNIFMHHYTQREFTYSPPAVNNVLVWRVKPEKISCKAFGVRPKKYYPNERGI